MGKSFIHRIGVVFGLFLLCISAASAQVVSVVPSSDCFSCDGEISISEVQWQSWSAVLVNAQEEQTAILSDVINTSQNLCPGLYKLTFVGSEPDEEYDLWVSIGTLEISAGIPTSHPLCLGGPSVNLFSLLQGNPGPGGVWSDVNNQIVSATFSPSVAGTHEFLYSLETGECLIQNKLILQVNPNANPGISTTYLICDHYPPFEMVGALFGQPDQGGSWFNSSYQPISGIYDPQIDDTEIFTYMIDYVPGCPPVFSTLFVMENPYPDSGEDNTISVCPNALPFDMTEMLGGSPNAGGQWYFNMTQPVSSVFDPQSSPAGVYRYQVNGQTPCPNVWSFLTIEFTDGISAGVGTFNEYCTSDTHVSLFDLLSENPDEGGTWTNALGEEIDPVFSLILPGEFELFYTVEAIGCQPVSSMIHLSIELPPTAGQFLDSALCGETEQIQLDDYLFGSDGGGIWLNHAGIEMEELAVSIEPGTWQFKYVAHSNVCPNDTAVGVVSLYAPATPMGSAQISVCLNAEDLALLTFAPELPHGGAWQTDGGQVSEEFVPLPGENTLYYVLESGNVCPPDTFVLVVNGFESAFASDVILVHLCESEGVVNLNSFLSQDVLSSGVWVEDVTEWLTIPGQTELFFTEQLQTDSPCTASQISFQIEVDALPLAGPDVTIPMCANYPDFVPDIPPGAWPNGQWTLNGQPIEEAIPVTELADALLVYQVPSNGVCPGASSELTIEVDFGISFHPGPNLEVCPDFEPVQIGAPAESGYTYQWIPELRLDNPHSAQPFISLDNPENNEVFIEYTILVSNGICTFQETVEVIIHPFPLANAGPDITLCSGNSLSLLASGGAEYIWNYAGVENPNQNPQILIAEESFTAEVEVISPHGCRSVDTVDIIVLQSPNVLFDVFPYEGCRPFETVVSNLSDNDEQTSYQWFINQELVSVDFEFETFLTAPGHYDFTLVATAENGCLAALNQENMVVVYGEPVAYFTYLPQQPDFIQTEVVFFNQSTGHTGSEWMVNGETVSFGTSMVYDFPDYEDLVYTVCLRVVNDHGCESIHCEDILIESLPAVYVPNAFTPDGDGKNDVLQPIMTGMSDEDYEFSIYNRWGQKIFSTNRPDQPWTGDAFDGNHYVQNEVYQWVLHCKESKTSVKRVYRGHVTIIR